MKYRDLREKLIMSDVNICIWKDNIQCLRITRYNKDEIDNTKRYDDLNVVFVSTGLMKDPVVDIGLA